MRLLSTEHLTREFGGVIAVNDVSFNVEKGLVTGLIGPNGAGKTTLFNQITGVDKPTRGNIIFDGQDITGFPAWKVSRLGIARTFQNIRLFRSMTVFDNVLTAMHLRARANVFSSILRLDHREEKAMREETEKLLKEQGLWKYRDEMATSLPYGYQRRLEIARALATKPHLLLLDEPAAGMNPQETLELASFIREIKEKYSLTVLMIEHHMDLVMRISDRVYVLDFGSLIAEGTPEEIQNDQRVIDAYLGVSEDV